MLTILFLRLKPSFYAMQVPTRLVGVATQDRPSLMTPMVGNLIGCCASGCSHCVHVEELFLIMKALKTCQIHVYRLRIV